MRCRQCDYPLWNLSTAQCPECGTPFDLREYRFTPGSVAFACPYCNALHGGSGPNYLPAETDTATCQQCGQAMSVPQMRVVPLTEQAEASSSGGVPWESRASLGMWKAWWQTCTMALTQPADLGRGIVPSISFWSAYWFTTLTAFLATMVNAVVCGGTAGLVLALGRGNLDPALRDEAVSQLIQQVVSIPASFITGFFMAGVFGGLIHLILIATGPVRYGFKVTALATLFAYGTMVLGLVPVCGNVVGAIWSLVATILVLIPAQGVSGGRATLGVLGAIGLLVVAGCTLGFLAIMLVAAVVAAAA